jgi:hypothetical protein
MDLQLGRAVSIVMQTTPYIVYRAMIYGAVCVAFALFLGVVGLIGLVFGPTAAGITFIGCLIAGGVLGIGRLLGEYVLYMLKAGHIALITEIVENGKLPEGISQTDWAKDRVKAYFKEVSVLALIDQFVKGIIRVINRTLFNVMNALPIPGMEGAAKAGQRIVDFSLTYVDEAVIAHTFKTKNENVYDAAKSGIVLYAQCWQGILKNAVALTLLSYVFVFICFIIFLVPLGIIALLLPAAWGGAKLGLFIFALFLGVSLKWILFDPIACTSTILAFLHECEGQTPNPEWEAKIESVSDKFRELKQQATEKMQEMAASPSQPKGEDPTPMG